MNIQQSGMTSSLSILSFYVIFRSTFIINYGEFIKCQFYDYQSSHYSYV